jgi:hypothetical protein
VRRTKSQILEEDTVRGVPEAEQKRVISEPIAIPARQLAAALRERADDTARGHVARPARWHRRLYRMSCAGPRLVD